MTDGHLPTRTEGEGETLDMPEGMGTFASGQVLGERYQILEMLGRGGMGEVWKAFDLKLRVEVALKALRPEFFKSERRLDMLRQEVRAAREVMSPNVCRIFDLEEVDGKELVSMEYVDGATLLAVLHERGPLELKEAQDIASQFLAGLEAIHKVGLVHRDIKPENIMLTRAGRVVVMDFGLARQEEEGGGSVAGTPAYMSPEQAAGQTLDPRADVYSAGVVLAEMVSPDGINDLQSRQSVWEGVRSEPANIPDTPWAKVIEKAVARDREHRFNTAHTLTRALEDVTLRVEGADDLHPYPGLSSFTEDDAEFFFGREAEIEQMWRKLEGPPRLLGLVGPSGAGKTSLLRAGVIPSRVAECAIVRCTPGTSAMASLRQALVPALGGDTEALGALAGGDDAATISAWSRWRAQHGKAMLIVDQFEELFTLNPADAQRRYAEVLNRLPVEADVHVMVSMRDDFLMECNRFEVLRPIVSDLTLVDRPTGANLRRALVQPATKCGYRFEDDELVAEMLAEVEGERGALPLLAFAAARLWDKRDREKGLLTRQAYHDIGGVGGALARHAEATLEKIGVERLPIVRELLRNLVTADGTRAIREWNELLSVFGDSQSESPEEVLRALIDARLLTSYEVREEDKEPTRMVEIIHESLLANWPRLVRWQTQDQEGAQIRDELRQAARSWDEHGRHDDRLWTGTAYREFTLWRERYPGGLSDVEEAFSSAMTVLAGRRKRRRRLAVGAIISLLVGGLAVVGTFWRQSVIDARRAEAATLLSLGQLRLEKDPTEALAYATSSLELSDSLESRFFALKALSEGPPAVVVAGGLQKVRSPRFSPDGRWLAAAGHTDEVLVWPQSGGAPLRLPGHISSTQGPSRARWTTSGLLVTGHATEHIVRVWSIPDGKLIRSIDFGETAWAWQVGETHLFAETGDEDGAFRLQRWKLPNGEAEDLGSVDWDSLDAFNSVFEVNGRGWIYASGNLIYYRPLPARRDLADIVVGRHDNDAIVIEPRHNETDRVWSMDWKTREYRCWSLTDPDLEPLKVIPPPSDPSDRYAVRDPSGHWWTGTSGLQHPPLLRDLSGLSGGRPLRLKKEGNWALAGMDLHPGGTWLVSSLNTWTDLVFWPLPDNAPQVVDGYVDPGKRPVVFSPDGKWLATAWPQRLLRLWPLTPGIDERNLAAENKGLIASLVFDDASEHLLLVGFGADLSILNLDGSVRRPLDGFSMNHFLESAAFSPSGRLVATGTGFPSTEKKVLRVWNLGGGEPRVFSLEPTEPEEYVSGDGMAGYEYAVNNLAFLDESTLYTAGWDGVRSWNVETGQSTVVVPRRPHTMTHMAVTADRKRMVTRTVDFSKPPWTADFFVHDISQRTSRPLHGFGDSVDMAGMSAIDPNGTVLVTGDQEGIIRVGRIDGGDPHLLIGHEGPIRSVAISPDLKWVASSGLDETLRLWPIPDLSKPPLHTLPREELVSKLKSLTNLRVVRDHESATGWKLTHDPFPGWETVPTW